MLYTAELRATVDDVNLVHDYESIFRAHHGRLVRALTVVAGSREAAADAVQDAFVKAHFRWRQVSQYEDPVGWIRRVAINKLRDDYRSATRRQRLVERLGSQRTAEPGEPEFSELAPLLATLTKQQRACVALFYVDGLSVNEIATALGVSDGAVKFHLHQGRERLRGTILNERQPS